MHLEQPNLVNVATESYDVSTFTVPPVRTRRLCSTANSCIFSIWLGWSALGFSSGRQAVGDEILNPSKHLRT